MHLCFRICLHFTICRYHHGRGSGSPQSFQFFRAQILFAQHVHRSSGINHKFSFLWQFWSGRRRCPSFNRVSHSFAGASFLLRGDLSWPLRSWGSRFWIIRLNGPFLSRKLTLVPHAFGEFDGGDLIPNFPLSLEKIFSVGNLETHNFIEYTPSVESERCTDWVWTCDDEVWHFSFAPELEPRSAWMPQQLSANAH